MISEAADAHPSNPSPRGKKLLLSIVVTILALLLLEVGARVFASPRRLAVHREHENIIEVLGLPEINAAMVFHPDLFWSLKRNLDGFPVSGRIRQQEMSFSITTNGRGLRGTAVEPKGSKLRILTLGDSCTFGVGVDDDETWPAQLEALLNRAGDGEYDVINAAVPGYTAFQGHRFLQDHVSDLDPDLVVACFGYNDKETWSSRSDAETARRLVQDGWDSPLMHSRFYSVMRDIFVRVKGGTGRSPRKCRPRLSAEEFCDKLAEMKQCCDERRIPLICVIWPVRGQIENNYSGLIDYQPIVAQTGQNLGMPVVNLVDAFLAALDPLFVDHVHANVEGCRIAAEAIGAQVRTSLRMLSRRRNVP